MISTKKWLTTRYIPMCGALMAGCFISDSISTTTNKPTILFLVPLFLFVLSVIILEINLQKEASE